MKYILAVFINILCLSMIAIADGDNTPPSSSGKDQSKITEVTVYQDRASIKREQIKKLRKGKTIIQYQGLTNTLDPKSLRAAVMNSSVELLGVSWEKVITNTIQNDKLSKLEKERINLLNQKTEKMDKLQVIKNTENYLSMYKLYTSKIISEQSTQDVNKVETDKWNEAFSFFSQQLEICNKNQQDCIAEIQKIDKEISTVKSNLNKYMNPEVRASYTVFIAVNAATDCSTKVELDYITYQSGWSPRYDVRIDPLSNHLKMDYLATVSQASGEEWNDVTLKLSTAQPQISAQPPSLKPLYLQGVKNQYTEEKGTKQITVNQRDLDIVDASASEPSEPANSSSSVKENGSSVTYLIKEKADIPSDSRPYQVTVNKMSLPVNLSYETIPSSKPFVFLKAASVNNSKYILLRGPVSIFRSSGFIGTTQLHNILPNGKLSFFAGINEGIKVKRELVTVYTEKSSLFKSGTTRVVRYHIILKNTLTESNKVTVVDHIPISQIEEVQVKLTDKTTPGYKLDKKTGVISWSVDVPKEQTKTVCLEYHVTTF